MLDDVDLLVCGAGPVGCVMAERAATVLGWKVLVVDRRAHVAGNCYDSFHKNGVMIHNYGPHYFRTNDDSLIDYLSKFTEWLPAKYEVLSSVKGKHYPFPINLATLEQFYSRPLDADAAKVLLDGMRSQHAIPRNSEEVVLNKVGRELYEAFYKNYTLKFEWMYERPEGYKDGDKFNGNSGVLIHLAPPDKIWPKCIEAQLEYNGAGDVFAINGAKFEGKTDRAAVKKAIKPVGQWNDAEIVCKGDTISCTMNGVKIASGSSASPTEGPIGFQAEGVPIRFRFLRVKSLD